MRSATAISVKKKEIATGDRTLANTAIQQLETVKSRYEAGAKNACLEYTNSLGSKKAVEIAKDDAKTALDAFSEDILNQFEKRINELLLAFGASFRIGKVSRSYAGGRPTSSYQLIINDTLVALGDSTSNSAEPSFKNTLSAGDRSSLPFAFFVAQSELDPKLAEKLLVFDDPLGSQDRSRRFCTQQQICRLATNAKQAIILSHERMFLREIWDASDSAKTRSLQLTRIQAHNTAIREWDIEDETSLDYFREVRILKRFLDDGDGDPRHVATTIRPVLEANLRINSPGQFESNEWLGNFISKIRDSQPSESLYIWQGILAELTDINDFSKRYHHGTNAGSETEPIDSGELASYVGRTLEIVNAS